MRSIEKVGIHENISFVIPKKIQIEKGGREDQERDKTQNKKVDVIIL